MNIVDWEQDKKQRYFLLSLGALCVLGLLMVYSSSYIYAKETFGSSSYLFFKQFVFLLLGIGALFVVSRTKLPIWIKYGPYINVFISFLILLTFIPGLGVNVKGAHRWLGVFGVNLQPGEFVKYSVLLCSIYYFENFFRFELKDRIKNTLFLLAPLILLLFQPDYGSFTICFLVISFVCYISNFSRKYFYTFLTTGTIAGIGLLFMAPYRVERLLAFLDPWKNPKTSGFQIIQSYLAFANGSIFGQGLGNSNEKLFYLPEAHNDFIFSVLAEELGFVGVFIVMGIYLFLIGLGFSIALRTKKRIALIVVASVVFVIGLQALLNMAVVLGLLPTKGLNLPFISYGGSSLISNFLGVGLLFSAIRCCNEEESQPNEGTYARY